MTLNDAMPVNPNAASTGYPKSWKATRTFLKNWSKRSSIVRSARSPNGSAMSSENFVLWYDHDLEISFSRYPECAGGGVASPGLPLPKTFRLSADRHKSRRMASNEFVQRFSHHFSIN